MCAVFNKKYTNANTDIIEILAGLNAIDRLMSDLVQSLESIIRQSDEDSLRIKAVETVLAVVSGAFQTSLVTYFMHRDLFPALMKVSTSTGLRNRAHQRCSTFMMSVTAPSMGQEPLL